MFLAIPCPVELRLSGANKWERIHRWQFQLCMPKYNLLTKHWLTKNNSFNDLCSTAYLGISKCAISAFHLLVYASLMSFFQVIVCTSTELDMHTRQHPSGDSQLLRGSIVHFYGADLSWTDSACILQQSDFEASVSAWVLPVNVCRREFNLTVNGCPVIMAIVWNWLHKLPPPSPRC